MFKLQIPDPGRVCPLPHPTFVLPNIKWLRLATLTIVATVSALRKLPTSNCYSDRAHSIDLFVSYNIAAFVDMSLGLDDTVCDLNKTSLLVNFPQSVSWVSAGEGGLGPLGFSYMVLIK